MEEIIGTCAGKVWRELAKRESASVAALGKAVGADAALVNQAIGWLAREGKVRIVKRGRTVTVALTEMELAQA